MGSRAGKLLRDEKGVLIHLAQGPWAEGEGPRFAGWGVDAAIKKKWPPSPVSTPGFLLGLHLFGPNLSARSHLCVTNSLKRFPSLLALDEKSELRATERRAQPHCFIVAFLAILLEILSLLVFICLSLIHSFTHRLRPS